LTIATALEIGVLLLPAQLQSGTFDAQLNSRANAADKHQSGAGNPTPVGADAKSKANGYAQTPEKDIVLQSSGESVDRANARIRENMSVNQFQQDQTNLPNRTDADMPQRHQTMRPDMNAPGSTQGQANMQLDPIAREGTAHLNIDDATRARYRFHNSHWWYQTEEGQWLIDNNGIWESFDPSTYNNPRVQSSPRSWQSPIGGNSQGSSGSIYYGDEP
tara:strand:+ start:205 stop:858 length:654 start_codon:yes stop_codon:yes gene_type:complete